MAVIPASADQRLADSRMMSAVIVCTHPRSRMDLFNAYRKTFASLDPDELVVWWYCGFIVRAREGLGKVPLTQAETIMVYRTRDIDADTFTIDWTEVGVFRDVLTGGLVQGSFNPFDGSLAPHPQSFVDGPATFTVSRRGEGVDIQLVQHNARIDGVRLEVAINAATLGLKQTETKSRTFHRSDGSLPPLDGPDATHIETVLSIWSPLAAVDDPAQRNVPSRGFYTSGAPAGRESKGSWASTSVQGFMQKASVHERVNPTAWDRLQCLYPSFFSGDRIDPEW